MPSPQNGPLDEPQKVTPPADENPPVLGSWNNVYTFVLGLHALIIILFYLFSRAYA